MYKYYKYWMCCVMCSQLIRLKILRGKALPGLKSGFENPRWFSPLVSHLDHLGVS